MDELKNFIRICKLSDLPENKGIRIEINDHDLAIFKIQGEVFVISNVCPHNHTSQMFNGYLNSFEIVCPVHGWKFDIRTGKTLSNHSNIRVYKSRVVDDEVYVKIPDSIFKW